MFRQDRKRATALVDRTAARIESSPELYIQQGTFAGIEDLYYNVTEGKVDINFDAILIHVGDFECEQANMLSDFLWYLQEIIDYISYWNRQSYIIVSSVLTTPLDTYKRISNTITMNDQIKQILLSYNSFYICPCFGHHRFLHKSNKKPLLEFFQANGALNLRGLEVLKQEFLKVIRKCF